ncbi:MAG: cbb3-type cytochrome c oxidase subunit 3 [Pseudomonadota bacterium]|nr:cbb3-type cytochrome c oxidase subunit 3 [Pseudomonadota bacterium]
MSLAAIFHSIWTLVVLIIFIGVVIWAFSRKHTQQFERAARDPIEDDDAVKPTDDTQH